MTRTLSSFPDSLRYKCTSCEELHKGLPDLMCGAPAYWNDTLDCETSSLDSDRCIIANEHFFLRCLLEIPIKDTQVQMGWGVWSSVSRDIFNLYADKEIPPESLPSSFFGWFSNSLPGYHETLNLKCALNLQGPGMRPLIELEPTDHPLSIDQRHGITVQRALELIEMTGIRFLSV